MPAFPSTKVRLSSRRAKDLMLAAACTAISPGRVYYPSQEGNPPKRWTTSAGRSYGQTEKPRSFIVSVFSQSRRLFQGPGQWAAFQRWRDSYNSVTTGLTQVLAMALNSVPGPAAEDAATSGQVNSFLQAVSAGVSARVLYCCDALVGMGSSGDGNRALEIQF